MEVFTYITLLIGLAFGILQIILFFKLWKATNGVREIAHQQVALTSILHEFVDKYQNHAVKDLHVVSKVEQQCIVEQPNIKTVEGEPEVIISGPLLNALTDFEKDNLKEAIRNGRTQETRYMLMNQMRDESSASGRFRKRTDL